MRGRETVRRIRHKHSRRSYLSVGVGGKSNSLTIQSLYPFNICICNTKVAMARAAFCVVLCAIYFYIVSYFILNYLRCLHVCALYCIIFFGNGGLTK